MGCYINPPTSVPVCLVDNGHFTAAAVAFDRHELKAFSNPADLRYKVWYMVPREEARKVSDLANWERWGRSPF